MTIQRKFTLIFIMFCILFVIAACDSNGGDMGENAVSEDMTAESNENNMGIQDADNEATDETNNENLETGTSKRAADTSAERKVIKNAALEIESPDAAKLYGEMKKRGSELGGYEFSYTMSNDESFTLIQATYKIPPDNINQLIDFVGEKGKIINSNMTSDDITDNYYDTKTRLESKRKSLQQYYTLLKKAETIEEITQLQGIIDQITEEIEVEEGKLKRWNSLVGMATITLSIRQELEPEKEKKEINWNALSFSDMGYLIKNGLMFIVNLFVAVFQWLVIALAVTSPVWAIVAILFWIYYRNKKNKQRKKQG